MKLMFFCFSVLLGTLCSCLAENIHTIELNETLGMSFSPQMLHYDIVLPKGALKSVKECRLFDNSNNPIPVQCFMCSDWEDGSVRQVRVSFISSLLPHEKKVFFLKNTGYRPSVSSELSLKLGKENIELTSSLTGVRIPSLAKVYDNGGVSAETVPAPIAAVRGKERWYGEGKLSSAFKVLERHVTVLANGPLYNMVEIKYRFTRNSFYKMTVFLGKNENVIRIFENFSMNDSLLSESFFTFNMAKGLTPDYSVNRPIRMAVNPALDIFGVWDRKPYYGKMFPVSYEEEALFGEIAVYPEKAGEWMHFACFNSKRKEMLGFIIDQPGKWRSIPFTLNPKIRSIDSSGNAQAALVTVRTGAEGVLSVSLPLKSGTRSWAFFTANGFPLDALVEKRDIKGNKKEIKNYAVPRQFFQNNVAKYTLNSLDRIKNYSLSWKSVGKITYPRLYADKKQIEESIKILKKEEAEKIPCISDKFFQQRVKSSWNRLAQDIFKLIMTRPVSAKELRGLVYPFINMTDLYLADERLTPAERRKILARCAYLAYFIHWQESWMPQFKPYMLGLMCCILPHHSDAKKWIEKTKNYVTSDLDLDAAGMATQFEYLFAAITEWQERIMLFNAFRHNNIANYWQEPGVNAFAKALIALQIPMGARAKGRYAVFDFGIGYSLDVSKMMGLLASGIAQNDLDVAKQLMWFYRRNKAAANYNPMTKNKIINREDKLGLWFDKTGYEDVYFLRPDVGGGALPFKGESVIPGVGAVLRSQDYTAADTGMIIRTADGNAVFDSGQSGISMWGKGVPLILENLFGRFQPWWCSRMNLNHMWDNNQCYLRYFFSGNRTSFVNTEMNIDNLKVAGGSVTKSWPMKPEKLIGRDATGTIGRKIFFMKEAVSTGTGYFVMRDVACSDLPAEWTLWVNGKVANTKENPIVVNNNSKVDLLVYSFNDGESRVATRLVKPARWERQLSLLQQKCPVGSDVLTVLYPCLEEEKRPEIRVWANNAGISLKNCKRSDWVFLPKQGCEIEVDGVSFKGQGAVLRKSDSSSTFSVMTDSSVATDHFGISANLGVELTLKDKSAKGIVEKSSISPIIYMSGKVLERLDRIDVAGKKVTYLKRKEGIQLTLPTGTVAFRVLFK